MTPREGEIRYLLNGAFYRLCWTEWGPVDSAAPPILCVHGLTRQGRDFDVIAQALAAQGRRVIAVDLPGRGRSDWLATPAEYVYPSYVVALAHLMAALGREVDWIGTSLGGICGMLMAACTNVPVRRMVINDVGPLIPKEAMARIRDYIGWKPVFADLAALEANLRKVHAPFGALSDAEWSDMAKYSARQLADGRSVFHYDPAIAEMVKTGPLADADLSMFWSRIAIPTLVVRGAQSDLLLAETYEQMLASGAKGLVVPDAGHAPMLNDAASVGVVSGFLGKKCKPLHNYSTG